MKWHHTNSNTCTHTHSPQFLPQGLKETYCTKLTVLVHVCIQRGCPRSKYQFKQQIQCSLWQNVCECVTKWSVKHVTNILFRPSFYMTIKVSIVWCLSVFCWFKFFTDRFVPSHGVVPPESLHARVLHGHQALSQGVTAVHQFSYLIWIDHHNR